MRNIPLTKGATAIVDDCDYATVVTRGKWHCSSNGYVSRGFRVNGKCKHELMHRFILNAPDEYHVDHIDGNPLNNVRANLRLAIRSENMRNRSHNKNNTTGFKGVTVDKRRGTFKAQIGLEGKNIYLGDFACAEDAYVAYCNGVEKYHGKFGRIV